MTTYTDNMDRGLAWLDANQPGWATAIDLSLLDMHHGNRCVMGQLGGAEYFDESVIAVVGLDVINEAHESAYDWATEHGFDTVPSQMGDEHGWEGDPEDSANDLWRTAILERL